MSLNELAPFLLAVLMAGLASPHERESEGGLSTS